MTRLEVWLDLDQVGWLSHDPQANRFDFDYAPQWSSNPRSFPISPRLPLKTDAAGPADARSAEVRQFFENLLPEGEALDHAARANGISKANLVGLMVALGRETSGAIRMAVAIDGAPATAAVLARDAEDTLRPITPEQLSVRIRQRDSTPFSVWDGRIRLSIAGYQDKIAVYERDGDWYLVEGSRLASTVIVKPVPVRPHLAGLPGNEFMCMQLAARVGLPVAQTRLVHVPEPVLLVQRFDRREDAQRVQRLHIIDACQALGLSVSMKYERPYGDGVDVRNIRDGVSYRRLFGLLSHSPQPARERQALLDWAIFQVLIGNTDAHGKNVSFFCSNAGLTLAPAYDMVCTRALGDPQLGDTYAMAIGDAFCEAELSPIEWASFASECGLPIKLVARRLALLAERVAAALPDLATDARKAGVPDDVVDGVVTQIAQCCETQADMAPKVARLRSSDL
ncbi:MAG: HipA domain-containing protein [Pseudomonadota bacterium]